MENLKFYIIKSKDGKYFRAKGYGGYGESWVGDIQSARVYQRIGPARTQVTFWAAEYPDYGVPDIIELTVSESKVLDEGNRVQKAIKKKKRTELLNKLHSAEGEVINHKRDMLRYRGSYTKEALHRKEEKVEHLKKELELTK